MQKLGEKLRTLRKQRGLTLRELALELNTNSYSYLGKIETGKRTPSAKMIFKIAKFFGVSTDQLMDDELEL